MLEGCPSQIGEHFASTFLRACRQILDCELHVIVDIQYGSHASDDVISLHGH